MQSPSQSPLVASVVVLHRLETDEDGRCGADGATEVARGRGDGVRNEASEGAHSAVQIVWLDERSNSEKARKFALQQQTDSEWLAERAKNKAASE
jgi:hypothetical protein